MSGTSYDFVKTQEIIGPVNVRGTLTALDDVVISDLFFVSSDTGNDASGLISRVGDTGVNEVVFVCVNTTTGLFEERIVFRCATTGGTGAGEAALCIPDFNNQGLLGFTPTGLVAYDTDGCFRPYTVDSILELTCETIVDDPDCIAAIADAILPIIVDSTTFNPADPSAGIGAALAENICEQINLNPLLADCRDALTATVIAEIAADQALDPQGPLAISFSDIVEESVIEDLLTVPTDPTTEFGTAFCSAVEACLADIDLPALLECASLELDTLSYVTQVQVAECVPDGVVGPFNGVTPLNTSAKKRVSSKSTGGVSALQVLPPSNDYPSSIFFSVVGDPLGPVAPAEPLPLIGISVDPGALPPTVDVTATDSLLNDALTTGIYSLTTSTDTAYQVGLSTVVKAPLDAAPLIVLVELTVAEITDPVIVPVTIPIAGEAIALEYSFLVNNTSGVVEAVDPPMEAHASATLSSLELETLILDALNEASITDPAITPAVALITLEILDPVVSNVALALPFIEPSVSGATVTFNLVGIFPLSTTGVKVNVTRTPLTPPVSTLGATGLSTKPLKKLLPVKKSIQRVTPKTPEPKEEKKESKKQVRIFSKLLSKKKS